ncbi:alcohol acyltransferase 9-like [Silene latifolia]|uniref:alcohol acyltransferase 9-like n=1 Tax=Silene latifolia TaxID=37657 RepID=UPI003D779112
MENTTTPKFVQVKNATIITPCGPTPNTILSLSTLDSQLFLRFTVEYLLLFKPLSGLDRTQFSAQIKSGLSRALVHYYPLSGRVTSVPGRTLQVVCQGQGVAFIEAVSGYRRVDFQRAPRHVEEWRQLLCFQVDDVLKGDPVLTVQLTWLADGAVAIGFGFNHTLCDGLGAAEFVNCFAELTRGVISRGPKPIWDRHLLDSNPNTRPKISVDKLFTGHPEFNRVPDCCGFLSKFSSEVLVPTSSVFSKVQINQLKRHACVTPEAEFTSFDLVSAHIWRCWAGSLQFPPHQSLKLLFSVNFRNRVKPGLPSGFYGNGFVLGCAQTTAKDLTEKGLGYASEMIRKAKVRVDDKYVREVIELVNGNKRSPDLVGVLILTQWTRLGLEKVDFGLGKPVHMGPICGDKYCLLLPVQNQRDAVRVMLAVPTSSLDLYQHSLKRPFS